MKVRLTIAILIGLVLFIGITISISHADTLIIDQSTTDPADAFISFFSIQSNSPIGQEFTPTYSSLNYVQLLTGPGGFTVGEDPPSDVELYVNIRQDSITGNILGTSEIVSFPENPIYNTDFNFSYAVSLVPGNLYVIDVHASGDNWIVFGGDYNYSSGRAIIAGNPDQGQDFWFREGIVVPEPISSTLFLIGGATLGFRRMRQKITN